MNLFIDTRHALLLNFCAMAKTSGYHPGSPNQTTERDMPTGKTKQVKRKVARKTPSPTKGNRKAPPEELGNRKAPPEDLQHLTKETMPTLRREDLPTTLDVRRSTRNRTPAPSPPKVLTIPGERHRDAVDPFHPLDYTNHGSPADLRILAQAAAATGLGGYDDLSASSESELDHGPIGKKGGSTSDKSEGNDSDSKDKSYKPPGDFDRDDLFYSDDDDLDAYFDHGLDEIEKDIEYSDPKKSNPGRRRTTTIVGGPAMPDCTGMDQNEKENAMALYKVQRKAYVDQIRRQRLIKHVDQNTLSVGLYTGCLHPTLRPMSVVEEYRLRVGDTFPEIELLKLRIAEEANLRGISYHTTRSEIRQLRCYGYKFVVEANNTEYAQGFVVTVCSVRSGDDYSNMRTHANQYNVPQERYYSPYRTSMVAPLIVAIIADNPGCTNKTLRGLLKPYGKEYAFTDSILQEARSASREMLFGTPEVNVRYAATVKKELEERGHIVRMEYTERRQTLKNIELIVLSEEMLRRKHNNNSTMSKEDRNTFIAQWKTEHRDMLMDQLGPKCVNVSFLHGIFFTPSFSQGTVPELQRLVMADACHLNFGKYTLYSCYGITANANMFPVGFAIIFGNENLLGWQSFWKFIVDIHPCLNMTDVTIVSDQDKGLFSAIAEVVPEAVNFHCSYHRSQNILKMCGGGKSGNKVYSALWVFNRLLQCRTVQQIANVKDKYFPMMHKKDLQYLLTVPDVNQYPAARCAMTPGTYMYHRTSSAAVESMNAANKEMRAKTAVDPLNACILLLKMECKRFIKQRDLAWSTDAELTPRGKLEFDEVFANINAFDFTITVSQDEFGYVCTVRRNINSQTRQGGSVAIVKELTRGSFFGKCSCGVDSRDAVPCEHMAALVNSSRIPNLTRENIMPYWWRTDHWRLQFPRDVMAECNLSMETIREDGIANTHIRYCPAWSAPNKSGRPKKNERRKSVLEKAGVTKVAKKPKLMIRFCQVCHKGSHVANECWELAKNAEMRPVEWKSALQNVQDVWDTLSTSEQDADGGEGTAD